MRVNVTDYQMLVEFDGTGNTHASRLLGYFKAINVDMISYAASKGVSTLCFSCDYSCFEEVLAQIPSVKADFPNLASVSVSGGYAKISIYDEDMVSASGFAARVIEKIEDAGAAAVLITTSEVDISVLIPAESTDDAVKALSDAC